MIITLTGCAGFLGINLAEYLLKNGHNVIGIDSLNYVSNIDRLQYLKKYSNFKFIHSDINDLKFLHDTDIIIHTAACSHVANSIISGDEFIKSNINGTYNLLELIRNYSFDKKPKLISISTDEVYGDILEGSHKETDILNPSNVYSASKAAADMLILSYGRTYGLDYNIIRPTNLYGLYQYTEKLIPKTIKYLMLNRRIPLHNNGTPMRNWLNVEDLISAIILIISKGESKEIYNVCGGYEQTNIDTVTKIIKIFNKLSLNHGLNLDKYVDFGYSRPGQDVRYSLDDSKIRSMGWKPVKNFNTELPIIVDYYKQNFIW